MKDVQALYPIRARLHEKGMLCLRCSKVLSSSWSFTCISMGFEWCKGCFFHVATESNTCMVRKRVPLQRVEVVEESKDTLVPWSECMKRTLNAQDVWGMAWSAYSLKILSRSRPMCWGLYAFKSRGLHASLAKVLLVFHNVSLEMGCVISVF